MIVATPAGLREAALKDLLDRLGFNRPAPHYETIDEALVAATRDSYLLSSVKQFVSLFYTCQQGGAAVLTQQLREEYLRAETLGSFFEDVGGLLFHGVQIEEVVKADGFWHTVAAFYAGLVCPQDTLARQEARYELFAQWEYVPQRLRIDLLNLIAEAAQDLTVVAKFLDRAYPGDLIRMAHPNFLLADLEQLTGKDYECAGVGDTELLFVRGEERAVCVPAGERLFFHTHPGKNEVMDRHIFPSRSFFADYNERSEFGTAVASSAAMVFFQGTGWSHDSAEPFEQRILEILQEGAEGVIAQLGFQADYARRYIKMMVFRWDILREIGWRIGDLKDEKFLPPSSVGENVGPDDHSLVGELERLNYDCHEEASPVFHPDPKYRHQTGDYQLIALRKK